MDARGTKEAMGFEDDLRRIDELPVKNSEAIELWP